MPSSITSPPYFGFILIVAAAPLICGAPAKPVEPRAVSVNPPGGRPGQKYEAVIRGVNLAEATGLYFKAPGFTARVLRVESIPAAAGAPAADLVHVEMTIAAGTPLGPGEFRVVTADGLTNPLALRVTGIPLTSETDAAGSLPATPAVIQGTISQTGEADDYRFLAKAGQTITFEAFGGGGNLDPSLRLYDTAGSWLNPKRMNLVAHNDEPLFYPGFSKDARLTHRFAAAGQYCIRVQGFNGQGGPDSVYQLQITEGSGEALAAHPSQKGWDERNMIRKLDAAWMKHLSERAGTESALPPLETYAGAPEGTKDLPVMKIPGVMEGRLPVAGQANFIRIQIDKPLRLCIEVETPEATRPAFHPVVRLMDEGGTEIVTNLYNRLNNNNLRMMKAMESKTTFDLQAPGLYTLEVRELTSVQHGDDFHYKVMVREQIPHLGKFTVAQDRIHLRPGETKAVIVNAEREEGFDGTVAIAIEDLPAGVIATTGLEKPDDKPPLPNAGKFERYQAPVQTAAVLLSTREDIKPMPMPTTVRVVARLIRGGHASAPVAITEVPLLITPKEQPKERPKS